MSVDPSTSAAAAIPPASAAGLLAAWEAAATPAQRLAQAPYQAAVLAWLTGFAIHCASQDSTLNVDLDDAATILRGAGSIRVAMAAAQGAGRVEAALQQLATALPRRPTSLRANRAVLQVTGDSLEMDELIELVEALNDTLLTDDREMILGLGSPDTLAPKELQIWLLLAYPE